MSAGPWYTKMEHKERLEDVGQQASKQIPNKTVEKEIHG